MDVLTKPLKLDVFLKMRGLLGVCEHPGVCKDDETVRVFLVVRLVLFVFRITSSYVE